MFKKKPKDKPNEGGDDVGYANPPQHSQFKPGTSGNPKGRPMRNRDGVLLEMLGKELYRPVPVQQSGRTVKLPALQVAVRRLTLAALKGDTSAVKALLQLSQLHGEMLAEQRAKMPPMTNKEKIEKIASIFDRVAARLAEKQAKRAEAKMQKDRMQPKKK